MATPYETLGIDEGATDAEVKAAYRKMAFQWHPDRFPAGEKAAASARFVQIQLAFETITLWRRSGAPPPRPGGRQQRSSRSRARRPPPPPPPKGPSDGAVEDAVRRMLLDALADPRSFGAQASWFPSAALAEHLARSTWPNRSLARQQLSGQASADDVAGLVLALSSSVKSRVLTGPLDLWRPRALGFALGREIDGLSAEARAACYGVPGAELGVSYLEPPFACACCLGAPSRLTRLHGLGKEPEQALGLQLCRECALGMGERARSALDSVRAGWRGRLSRPRLRLSNALELCRTSRLQRPRRSVAGAVPMVPRRPGAISARAWAAGIVAASLAVGLLVGFASSSHPPGSRVPRTAPRSVASEPTVESTTTTTPRLAIAGKFGVGRSLRGLRSSPSLPIDTTGTGPMVTTHSFDTETWHYAWSKSGLVERYWRAFPDGTTVEEARRTLLDELPSDATSTMDADITVWDTYSGATHVACHTMGWDSAQLSSLLSWKGVPRQHVAISLYSLRIAPPEDGLIFWPWPYDPTEDVFDPSDVTMAEVQLVDGPDVNRCYS